jgi:formiminoglutamase
MQDPRISDQWRCTTGRPLPGDFLLIGFPQDEGVRRNAGRPGAADAPERIRTFLGRLVALPGLSLIDAGDVPCDADLEASQVRLAALVGRALSAGAVPIILGGGHETAYGHFLGYVSAGLRCGMLNIDAHLDVRPLRDGLGHSGSPFRQALEYAAGGAAQAASATTVAGVAALGAGLPGVVSAEAGCVPGGYLCLGVQPHVNAAGAFEYMRSRGAEWRTFAQLRAQSPRALLELFAARVRAAGGRLLVSVDLDAACQAVAPGVSAPSPTGLQAEELVELVRTAAALGAASLDLVECNPAYDRDDQTARLAALLAYEFMASSGLRQVESG